MVSTLHTAETLGILSVRAGTEKVKPKYIIAYNICTLSMVSDVDYSFILTHNLSDNK
jgi:hypothetical protein